MQGGTITVYESHDPEGDMLFTVHVETYSRRVIDELKHLAGEDAVLLYVPDGQRVNASLDGEEVDSINHAGDLRPAPGADLGDVLVDVIRDHAAALEDDGEAAWKDSFPAGWKG